MSYEQAEKTAVALAEGLEEIAAIVGEQIGLADRAEQLRRRAEEVRADRFKVIVVGEFKRGKSTVLNAMLGSPILPQKVPPCTPIVTRIQYGERPEARVIFTDGRADEVLSVEEFCSHYQIRQADVAEDIGEDDRDRFWPIDYAIIRYPIELCRHRVELIDSPGLGERRARTERTQKYLPYADAVIMVLDATQLCSLDEVYFLEAVLWPLGLRNIFFLVNKWNLVPEAVLDPREAQAQYEELRKKIRDKLTRFCLIDGTDRSTERIFCINAFGALKARLAQPPCLVLLEKSNLPAFENSLQRFLVENRARARNEGVLGNIQTILRDADQYISVQLAVADKSVADIEAERKALEPKLERLRLIRQSVADFIDATSGNLQERLAVSFHKQFEKISQKLPEAVAKFDLDALMHGFMTWKVFTDWAKSDENKFAKQIERHISPQLQRYLETECGAWHQSVIRNEMKTIEAEVKKQLLHQAADFLQEMQEIEARLHVQVQGQSVESLVSSWIGRERGRTELGEAAVSGPQLAVLGDMSILIGSIVGDIVLDLTFHATGALWLPILGILWAAMRTIWREITVRQQIKDKIVEGLRGKLPQVVEKRAMEIRQAIKKDFENLKQKITDEMDDEIAAVDASIQAILDRKRSSEYSADQERQRLEKARASIVTATTRLLEACASESPAT
jgi:GTPase SAR1 family protein